MMDDEKCERCGKPIPGDHEQEVVTERYCGLYGSTPRTETFVYWICAFAECEKPMQSGLACNRGAGHDGPCFDKFGLRDPLPCS